MINNQLTMLLELIHHMSHMRLSIRISGEKGSGKKFFACQVYRMCRAKQSRFIALNCAQQWHMQRAAKASHCPEEARYWMNHLFSETGPATYYLEEIERIPLHLQDQLAEIFTSAGPLFQRSWFIASSLEPLEHHVAEGRCREALLAAMDIMHIAIKPLRTRPESIPRLLAHFLNRQRTLDSLPPLGMPDPRVMDAFIRYSWPGNLFELRKLTNRALATGKWPTDIKDWQAGQKTARADETPELELADLMPLAELYVQKGKLMELLLSKPNPNGLGLLDLILYDEALSQITGEP